MKPTIGISACLAGQQIRYNGSSLKHGWITDTLSTLVNFVPVCPEVAMGLGTPRNALRLERNGGEIFIKEINSGLDLTDSAKLVSTNIVKQLPELDGYVFAAKSPTCGLERVKVYSNSIPFNDGVGIFAGELIAQRPELPVIDSGKLHNEELRELFIKSVFTLARFNRLERTRCSLQKFHRQHKFSLLAHHPDKMRDLGRIAASSTHSIEIQFDQYRVKLIELLKIQPSKGGLINALQHMYGFLKKSVSVGQKSLFIEILEKFRMGTIPVSVPLKMLQMLQAGAVSDYLSDQFAWNPAGTLEVQHVI